MIFTFQFQNSSLTIQVCIFAIWLFKVHFTFAAKSQNSHLNGFSPVWILTCLLISAGLHIILEQIGHPYFLTPSFNGRIWKNFKKITFRKIINKTKISFEMKFLTSCLFMSVCQVLFQSTLQSCSKITKVALKWFFSSVSSDMSFDICWTFHSSSAKWTFIFPASKSDWLNLKLIEICHLTNFEYFIIIASNIFMNTIQHDTSSNED